MDFLSTLVPNTAQHARARANFSPLCSLKLGNSLQFSMGFWRQGRQDWPPHEDFSSCKDLAAETPPAPGCKVPDAKKSAVEFLQWKSHQLPTPVLHVQQQELCHAITLYYVQQQEPFSIFEFVTLNSMNFEFCNFVTLTNDATLYCNSRNFAL